MEKKISRVIIFLLVLIIPFGLAMAENYNDYTLEQIEAEIADLEAKLDQLYKLREEKKPKATSSSDSWKTYTGNGDDVVILDPIDDWFVFEIDGNKEEAYFGVIAYDKNGQRLTALVNTTDSYHGIVYDKTQSVTTLEINAKGSWSISVKSLYDCQYGMKGSTVKGTGDDVILFYSDKGRSATATIKGNAGEDYFGIIGYDKSGNRITAYVNTTDKYDGKVLLKGEPVIFEINATGEWEINFE